MPLLIPNPSFIIHESCYVYIILHYIHVRHHSIHTQLNRSSKNKQTSKHSIVSPSTSLRLRGLPQARQSRSSESPSAQARAQTGTGKQRGISLRRDPSPLGKLFARSKTHSGRLGDHSCRKLWATLCTFRLGEASSPGQVYQCLPLFAPAQRIHSPNRDSSQTLIAMHKLKEFANHNNTGQNTPHEKVLASLTWKQLEGASTLTNGAQQLKGGTCELNKTVEQSQELSSR